MTRAHDSEPAWGVYHAAGSGRASWYDVARQVLLASDDLAPAVARLVAIKTGELSTGVERPMNSALDCAKLERDFLIKLPRWQHGVTACVRRMPRSIDHTEVKA